MHPSRREKTLVEFALHFSDQPFEGSSERLDYVRSELGEDGSWSLYWMEIRNMEGWLCPNLFKFFLHAPEHLYVKAEL